jgi:hypothetical protein
MSKTPLPARTLRLRRGDSVTLRLPEGSFLVVRGGRLRLEGPPAWLAEHLHLPRHRLQAGDAHLIDSVGWLRLSADSGTVEVLILLPAQAPAWQRLLGLFRLGARRLDHLRPLA